MPPRAFLSTFEMVKSEMSMVKFRQLVSSIGWGNDW